MTTLRSLLEEYADTVPAELPPTRIPSVHQRIRTARRRRTAGAVAAVVALLIAGTLGLALPHDAAPNPADAPSRLAGHAVPPTTTSLGATYSYVRGYQRKDGRIQVKLPASGTPLLVRAASQSPSGRLAIGTASDSAWVTPAGDFGSFYAVDPGAPRQIRLQLHGGAGTVALAVYRQTAPAPGYHRGGVTYPAIVAGNDLLGAVVSDQGTPKATLDLDHVTPFISVMPYCSGGPAGTRVRVRDADGVFLEGGCDDRPGIDAAHEASSVVTRRSGTSFRVEAIDRRGRPVTGDVRVGLGVYEATKTDLHSGLSEQVDAGGHRWTLASVQRSSQGVTGMGRKIMTRRPVLVRWGGGAGPATVQLRVDGSVRDQSTGGGIGSDVVSSVAGRDQVGVRASGHPRRPLVLAIYHLGD